MPRATSAKPGRILLRRLAWVGGSMAVLWFTFEGGEYGTSDLLNQKGRKARLDAEVEQIRAEVDSLRAELKAIKTDDDRLEHIAREKYGMVKGGKELLYWVGAPSTSGGDTVRAVADSTE